MENEQLHRPLSREHSGPEDELIKFTETEFEKPRGVNRVEIRRGFARVHVSALEQPITEKRLKVLKAIAEKKASIDFLKFTPSGLSFLCQTEDKNGIEEALTALGVHFTIQAERCIFLAHAVNMRDEEGLIAQIIREAISTGAHLDHMSDMHDRVLIVTDEASADRLSAHIHKAMEVSA